MSAGKQETEGPVDAGPGFRRAPGVGAGSEVGTDSPRCRGVRSRAADAVGRFLRGGPPPDSDYFHRQCWRMVPVASEVGSLRSALGDRRGRHHAASFRLRFTRHTNGSSETQNRQPRWNPAGAGASAEIVDGVGPAGGPRGGPPFRAARQGKSKPGRRRASGSGHA